MAQASKNNAISLGLDVASLGLSLVPGGGFARTMATTVPAMFLTAASGTLSAAQYHGTEAATTYIAGAATTQASVMITSEILATQGATTAAKTVASWLPGVGTAISGLELIYDGIGVYQDYQKCMVHP